MKLSVIDYAEQGSTDPNFWVFNLRKVSEIAKKKDNISYAIQRFLWMTW